MSVLGISGISGVSGYSGVSGIYPAYNTMPVRGVRGADTVNRGTDGTAQAAVDGAKNASRSGRTESGECQTCKKRKYVDGSNENDVSFKTPTHINPNSAPAAVMGHEREHLSNAIAEGSEKGKELVSASITLHTDICPECGRVYVSGGTTHTKIRRTIGAQSSSVNPYEQKQADLNYLMSAGKNLDISA